MLNRGGGERQSDKLLSASLSLPSVQVAKNQISGESTARFITPGTQRKGDEGLDSPAVLS